MPFASFVGAADGSGQGELGLRKLFARFSTIRCQLQPAQYLELKLHIRATIWGGFLWSVFLRGDGIQMDAGELKVLVVDDDPAILRIITKWLESSGYQVRQAADGRAALAEIERECPYFLVTDWDLPLMDGVELCRAVRQLNLPHYVYTVFLTARTGAGNLIEGLQAGADDFLSKPVQQGELLARLLSGARVLTLEKRLSELARTDALTGLANQRTFYEVFNEEWQRANRYHLPLSSVMLDIDFFKRVNDTHGHPAGDEVLKAVSRVLTVNSRATDLVCRYGGEEFCALLPETTEDAAAIWAERVRTAIAAIVVPINGESLRVTGSLGVAQRREDTVTPAALVDLADQALLLAKRSGRDRVVRFASLDASTAADGSGAGINQDLFHGIVARHVMASPVVCLQQDNPVGPAAELFLHSRLSSAPVVNESGVLVGILSEKDLMGVMLNHGFWNRPIREVMRPNVVCYEEDAPIQTIYDFLCRVTIRRVIVVKDGRPTGAISRASLLRWYSNWAASKGAVVSEESIDLSGVPVAHPRARLRETAQALTTQAVDLEHRIAEDPEDLIPYVVGGASRVQELVTDLLAYSRYANEPAGATA
ncbi:MAG: diguanylate cyclase [Pirellulales bacterium]